MLLQTVKVFHPNGDGVMVINAKDFDDSVHKLYSETEDIEQETEFSVQEIIEDRTIQKQEPEKKRPGRKPSWR